MNWIRILSISFLGGLYLYYLVRCGFRIIFSREVNFLNWFGYNGVIFLRILGLCWVGRCGFVEICWREGCFLILYWYYDVGCICGSF